MPEVGPLLVLLALCGGALTVIGSAFAWFMDEARRIRRTLTEGLGVAPQPMLIARGRGVGIGFDLANNAIAVTWDRGAWRLPYRIDELVGVELIIDRYVAARFFRGEPRYPLDQFAEPMERVRLRFVFDVPDHPDFDIDLWRPEDDGRRGRREADEALLEANRWLARMEALLRRQLSLTYRPAVGAPIHMAPPHASPLADDDAPERAVT